MKRISLFLISLLYIAGAHADLKDQWREFLVGITDQSSALPSYAADSERFKLLLSDLTALQSLPLWRATTFYQAINQQPSLINRITGAKIPAHQLLKKFADEYTPEMQSFMTSLIAYKNSLSKINAQRGSTFTHESTAEQLWRQVQNDLITPLKSQEFINNFKAAPSVIKLITCDIMRQCIDTIDTTIKTLKSSNTISLSQRINQFKIMLNDFNEMFRTWVQHIMPEHALQYHNGWPLDNYLEQMRDLYIQIMLYNDIVLQRSSGFSVNAAMLGSCTAFERHYPETAEDMFMLIHQNSLITVAAICDSIITQQGMFNSFMDLPASLTEAINYFEQKSIRMEHYSRTNAQRIGINYTQDTIELFYNMPLRNHSSTFQIIYHTITQQCTFTVQFIGQARQRWEQIAFLAAISNDLSGLTLVTDIALDTQAGIASWGWVINGQKDLPLIADYLSVMAQLSFEINLHEGMLNQLHRSSSSLNQTMRQASSNYQNRYGQLENAWLLSLGQ